MKKIDREVFTQQLESVQPGLSKKEDTEQSTCYAFVNGRVHTYNDEVTCSAPCDIDIEGAVQSKLLLTMLKKIKEKVVRVAVKDGQFIIKQKRGRTKITMEKKILLPLDSIDTPDEWNDLPEAFTKAINIVKHVAGIDESRFVLTCLHIHPNWIEACDDIQALRYNIQMDVDIPLLVRAESIKNIPNLGVDQFSKTENWIHFRNSTNDLVVSCRLYIEDYPDLSPILDSKGGSKVQLLTGLREASEKAEIFSQENVENDGQVEVHIRSGRIKIKGESNSGSHTETRKTTYDGPPLSFLIAPKLLSRIAQNHKKCIITENALHVDGGDYKFATGLGTIEEK